MTSFADLVDARWRSLATPDDPTGHERYAALRARFEQEHGRIVAAHWSTRQAAGVAICCRQPPTGACNGRCIAAWGAWPHGARSSRRCCATSRASPPAPAASSPAARSVSPSTASSPAAATSWPPWRRHDRVRRPRPATRPLRPGPAAAASRTASFGDLVHRTGRTRSTPPTSERASATRRPASASRTSTARSSTTTGPSASRPASRCAASACASAAWSGRCTVSWGTSRSAARSYSPLLLRIARQSVRANSLLRGMTQRMATANLFALSRDIMASLEAKGDDAAQIQAYTARPGLHRGLRRRGGQARGARRLPQGPAVGRGGARGAGAGAGLCALLRLGPRRRLDAVRRLPGRRVAGRGHERPHPHGRRQASTSTTSSDAST